MLEVPNLVGKQEAIRHKLVIDGKESLQATDYDAEDVLLGEVVHQRVTVENTLAHLDDVQIVVAQRHAVPKDCAVAGLVSLPVAILSDDVLHRVELAAAMVGVDDDLIPPQDGLLITIHQVVRMDAVLLLTLMCLLVERVIIRPYFTFHLGDGRA